MGLFTSYRIRSFEREGFIPTMRYEHRKMGTEGIEAHQSHPLRKPLGVRFKMGTEGIEPPSSALEADILPVYDAPLFEQEISYF